MTEPAWVPPGHKQAPMPLLRVQAFVNTRDLSAGTDRLEGLAGAAPWLRAAGLLGPDAAVTAAGLRSAREVREAIRALLDRPPAAGDGPPPLGDASAGGGVACTGDGMAGDGAAGDGMAGGAGMAALMALNDVAGPGRLRLSVGPDGTVRIVPESAAGLDGGLLGLLLVIRDAQRDGTWARLKVCGNPACRWAFYDRSHGRRGSWCAMASCGNLMKNRSLRARRRAS